MPGNPMLTFVTTPTFTHDVIVYFRPSPFPCGSCDVMPQKEQPVVDEEKNDIMRAGLVSKAVEHITLLVEDWFTGVRPRSVCLSV